MQELTTLSREEEWFLIAGVIILKVGGKDENVTVRQHQGQGQGQRPRNDLFCFGWDVKLSQLPVPDARIYI